MGLDIRVECFMLSFHAAAESRDIAVCHCTSRSVVVHCARKYVGCGAASCDDGGLGSVGRSPRTMCPSRTEFADGTVCGAAYSGCFCCHCHLMVHYAEHRSLQYLSLDKRTFDNDDRLVRECYFTFSHRIDGSGELHRSQITTVFGIFFSREKFLEEDRVHVSEISDHFDHFVCSAYHSPVVVFRSFSVEQVEYSVLVFHSAVIKGFSHCILVLVRAVCEV